MQKVLFPTDFSKSSLNTLDYAAEFCNKIQAKLILLNVMLAPVITGDAPMITSTEIMTTNQKAVEEKLEILAFNTRNKHNIIIDIKATYGFPLDSILDFAKTENVDLIILSAKGESNVLDKLFGNVTLNLFDKTDTPILSIPENAAFKDFNSIAFATSNVLNDAAEVFKLMNLTKAFQPKIKLVHIKKGNDFENEIFEEYNNLEYIEIERGEENRVDNLINYLNENTIDIVCVKKYKLPFFYKLLNKSFTKDLFQHSRIPLFIFNGD